MRRTLSIRPDAAVVLTAAMLCITIAAIHVLDQGGITAYAGSPWWIGWGYRAVEVGGILTAVVVVARADLIATWWVTAALAFGPFVVYLLTRAPGLPGDPFDKGAWNNPIGTISLLVEATTVMLALVVLSGGRRRASRGRLPGRVTAREVKAGTGAVVMLGLLVACTSHAAVTAISPAPAQAAQDTATGRTVTVTETEYHITLSRTTSLHAGSWTFVIHNAGHLTHALSISGPGVANATSPDVAPGGTAKFTVTLRRGRYDVFCPISDHRALGMDTSVTVG